MLFTSRVRFRFNDWSVSVNAPIFVILYVVIELDPF